MTRKILILIVFLTSTIFAFSQETVSELYGFKIHQYKEVVTNEFGKPFKVNNFDDGFVSEIFLLKEDKSAYIIFEYPNWNKEIIFSIQIYGAFEDIDLKFRDLKMGISEKELIKKIGKPTKTKDIGEYGKMLEYENTNYSFEIDKTGKLSSIKILDNYNELFPKPNVEKIPTFERIKSILTSGNSEKISKILSPEIEIYLNNETLSFKYAWEKEIKKDKSKIYATIKELVKGIENFDYKDENNYEENMRLTLGENPKHVLKFKKGFKIKEIVMKWEDGKFVIWEIKT
ncbi:MAG TPA: hypothetical protein ENK46_11350 [Flavobacteriia bacterium]|nr:hypothetical protein [Flavobacteriia bacterium]